MKKKDKKIEENKVITYAPTATACDDLVSPIAIIYVEDGVTKINKLNVQTAKFLLTQLTNAIKLVEV